jgi:phosphatidylserine/phosphatidylglycerophosphate/cardiolipin synthase-like enzyme
MISGRAAPAAVRSWAAPPNLWGRPGKLHAKVALVDDFVLVSSANLTDDAFNRNLEVGVLLRNPEFLVSIRTYLESLLVQGCCVGCRNLSDPRKSSIKTVYPLGSASTQSLKESSSYR